MYFQFKQQDIFLKKNFANGFRRVNPKYQFVNKN